MSTQVATGTGPRQVARDTPAAAVRTAVTAVAALVVAAFAFVVAITRQPGSARDNLWAEDGTRFLTGAYLYPLPRAIFEPYSAYLHLYPRLAGAVAAALPVSRAAEVLSAAGCLVTATCAAAVIISGRGLMTRLPLRILVAGALPLLPSAGSAATANVANAHVWLDLLAVIMLFRPLGRTAGRGRGVETVAAWIAVLLAVGSDPQALILLSVVAGRIVLTARRRRHGERRSGLAGEIVTAVLLAAAGAVQVVTVATHTIPTTGVHPTPSQLGRLYLRDVLSALLLGARRSLDGRQDVLVLPAVGVVVALAVTLVVSRTQGLLATALVVLSVALWSFAPWLKWTPQLLGHARLQTTDARYTVLSAALMLLALTCCLDSWLRRLPWPAALAITAVVAVAAGFAWAPTESVGVTRPPTWAAGVRAAQTRCGPHPGAAVAFVPGSPATFGALVPCSRVR